MINPPALASARETGLGRRPLSGSLDQLSVPDLLQTAEAGQRSGVILVRAGRTVGTVWMRGGRVVDAEIEGGVRGADAVYEMAFWEDGTFEADFTPVSVPERIFQPTSALLLEAMRRRDEALRQAPPPHAAIPDPPPPPPRPLLAAHRALTLLTVTASYASDLVEPVLLERRLEEARQALLHRHPVLAAFRVGPGGAVTAPGSTDDVTALVAGVAQWLVRFFSTMDHALPGRFPLRKLRQITEAVQDDLEALGFYRELGLAAEIRE